MKPTSFPTNFSIFFFYFVEGKWWIFIFYENAIRMTMQMCEMVMCVRCARQHFEFVRYFRS